MRGAIGDRGEIKHWKKIENSWYGNVFCIIDFPNSMVWYRFYQNSWHFPYIDIIFFIAFFQTFYIVWKYRMIMENQNPFYFQ